MKKSLKGLRVSLIGSGNVAGRFGHSFRNAGAKIISVYSLHHAHAAALAKQLHAKATRDISETTRACDLCIIAVSDDALPAVVKKISKSNAVIVHTSGSLPMSVLQKLGKYGVLYPLQTLSEKRALSPGKIPLCIEASDKKTLRQLEKIAAALSKKVFHLDSKQRLHAHLAAVFASNFTNHFYAIAADLLKAHHLPFDLVRPLILETAQKVQDISPDEAQTGPALRNDKVVVQKHLELLAKHPSLKKIYREISGDIMKRKRRK